MKHIHRTYLPGDNPNELFLYNIELKDGIWIERATIHLVVDGVVGENILPNPDNLSFTEQAALYNLLIVDGIIKFPQ